MVILQSELPGVRGVSWTTSRRRWVITLLSLLPPAVLADLQYTGGASMSTLNQLAAGNAYVGAYVWRKHSSYMCKITPHHLSDVAGSARARSDGLAAMGSQGQPRLTCLAR